MVEQEKRVLMYPEKNQTSLTTEFQSMVHKVTGDNLKLAANLLRTLLLPHVRSKRAERNDMVLADKFGSVEYPQIEEERERKQYSKREIERGR